MNFMASGRSALIITAGLWLCFAGPISAQQSDQDAAANAASDSAADTESPADAPAVQNKPVKPRAKKPATAQARPPAKLAYKPSNTKRADDAEAFQDEPSSSNISPAVSNAKAQLGAGGSAADNALKAMSAQADNTLKTVGQGDPADLTSANTEAVASDQLNDVDRALSQNPPSQDRAPAPPMAMATAQMPSAASNVDSTWGRTSLIGKVFVALGGLLTLASAARMFVA